MARGVGAFAQGLVTGFTQGKKAQREQELHELQVAKLRDDKAMAEEMKQARANMEPVHGFEVVTPTGERATFADEAAAKEAATSMDGAEIRPRFMVGDQVFDSEDQAEAAAEMFNAPAAKARRQAEVALKYNRPDVAQAHQQAYKSMIDSNRYESQQRFLDARNAGDLDAVATVLNGNMRTQGVQTELSQDAQGNVVQRWMRNGQVVGERAVPADQFWEQAAMRLSEAPDNMFEHVKFREGMRRDRRDADLAERKFGLDVENTRNTMANRDAGTAQGWARVGQGAQGLSLRQQELEFDRQRQLYPAPSAVNTVDPATGMGQVSFVGQQGQYTPGRGITWTPREPATVPLPGQPMSTYNTMNRPTANDGLPGVGPASVWDGWDASSAGALRDYNDSRAPRPAPGTPIPGGGIRMPDGSVRGRIERPQ